LSGLVHHCGRGWRCKTGDALGAREDEYSFDETDTKAPFWEEDRLDSSNKVEEQDARDMMAQEGLDDSFRSWIGGLAKSGRPGVTEM